MYQQGRKLRVIAGWKPTRWHWKLWNFWKKQTGGEKEPFMGRVEFNPVLNVSEGYIGHGDNQAFSLWNNSHFRLVYCLLYQIKAFGLVWADNYTLISVPLILEMVFPLFLSSLCPRVKLSCDFVGFWWHSLAVSANGRAVWRITFYLKPGIELQSAGALVHTEGFFLTLCSAASKDDYKPQERQRCPASISFNPGLLLGIQLCFS